MTPCVAPESRAKTVTRTANKSLPKNKLLSAVGREPPSVAVLRTNADAQFGTQAHVPFAGGRSAER